MISDRGSVSVEKYLSEDSSEDETSPSEYDYEASPSEHEDETSPSEDEDEASPSEDEEEVVKIIWNYTGNKDKEVPKDVTMVVVTHGVKSIHDKAFEECKELVSIIFSDSVTHIGFCAFRYCEKLISIRIPESMMRIGSGAFRGCTSLATVHLPTSLRVIGEGAFSDCISLHYVSPLYLPLCAIGDKAFYNCKSLRAIYLPPTIERIGCSAFEGCESLTTVELPSSIVVDNDSDIDEKLNPDDKLNFGQYAFARCTSLSSISVPAKAKYYNSSHFRGCKSLKSIHIYQSPDGNEVEGISDEAIEFLTDMIGIYPEIAKRPCTDDLLLPLHVITTFGIRFENLNYPLKVIINSAREALSTRDPKYHFYPFLLAACAFIKEQKFSFRIEKNGSVRYMDPDLVHVNVIYLLLREVPCLIDKLGSEPRCSNSKLLEKENTKHANVKKEQICSKRVKIEDIKSNGVRKSDTYVYEGYYGNEKVHKDVTHVVIKCGIDGIQDGAFQECTKLVFTRIPNSVTYIDADAFRGCASLPFIQLPATIITIGKRAFYECTSLSSINLLHSTLNAIGKRAFYKCTSLTAIDLPNTIENIGCCAFKNCTELVSINIPDSVTHIELHTFYGCTSLSTLHLPASLDVIGKAAFYKCTSLLCIDLVESSLLDIYEYTFSECKSLASIELPPTLKRIWSGAFRNCTKLVSINIPDSVTYIDSEVFYGCASLSTIHLPASLGDIGQAAFFDCSSLSSITLLHLPLREIGRYAFSECKSLTSIELPPTLKRIWSGAFRYCTKLVSINIPDSVTYIDSLVFCGCTSLSTIHLPASLGDIGQAAFFGCSSLSSITLLHLRLREIGRYAFSKCKSLTSIELPPTLKRIGYGAFEHCTSLTTLKLPPIPLITSPSIPDGYKYYSDGSSIYNQEPDYEPDYDLDYEPDYDLDNESDFEYNETHQSDSDDSSGSYSGFKGAYDRDRSIFSMLVDGYDRDRIFLSMLGDDSNCDKNHFGPGAFGQCKSLSSIYAPATVHYYNIVNFRGCESLKSVKFYPSSYYNSDEDPFSKEHYISDETSGISDEAIEFLYEMIKMYPQICKCPCTFDLLLPLHVFTTYGISHRARKRVYPLELVINAAPEALSTRDPKYHFYPFLLAACAFTKKQKFSSTLLEMEGFEGYVSVNPKVLHLEIIYLLLREVPWLIDKLSKNMARDDAFTSCIN